MDFTAAKIRSLPLTYSIKVRGRPTCYWLRCSAEVQAAKYLTFHGLSMPNPAYDQRKYCATPAQELAPVPAQELAPNIKSTNKTTGAASPSPADGQAQRRQEEKAKYRTLVQSQLRSKMAERMPKPDSLDKEVFKQRVELVKARVKRGLELVLGGMSVDDAVEKVFNETVSAVSKKGAQ